MKVIDAGARRLSSTASRALNVVIATGASPAMLPIRLAIGLIFFAHGAQKLFGAFGGPGLAGTGAGFEQLGFSPGGLWAFLVGFTELTGGILLMLGLLARAAAVALSIVMVVAVATVHWQNGFFMDPAGPNHGIEYNLALVGGLLAMVVYGAGWLSVDRELTRSSSRRRPPPSAP